jgi:hypothetical protein
MKCNQSWSIAINCNQPPSRIGIKSNHLQSIQYCAVHIMHTILCNYNIIITITNHHIYMQIHKIQYVYDIVVVVTACSSKMIITPHSTLDKNLVHALWSLNGRDETCSIAINCDQLGSIAITRNQLQSIAINCNQLQTLVITVLNFQSVPIRTTILSIAYFLFCWRER